MLKEFYNNSPLEELKVPLIQGRDKPLSSGKFKKHSAISSIHSNLDDHAHLGADVHFLIDIPSPKFSSALGDDIGEDEEKNEIIRCILNSDSNAL